MRERGKCYRKTKNGRYEAYVSDHCRFISLGTYDNKDDAIIAVDQYKDDRLRAAVQNFGHEPEDGIIYEDNYLVFSNGDIFNLDGHKMSPSVDRHGYLHGLINGKNRSYHIIIAECFVPNPYNKPDINHINGITSDNRLENLRFLCPNCNSQITTLGSPKQKTNQKYVIQYDEIKEEVIYFI